MSNRADQARADMEQMEAMAARAMPEPVCPLCGSTSVPTSMLEYSTGKWIPASKCVICGVRWASATQVSPESCPGEEGYKVPDSGDEFWRKSAWAAEARCIGLENTIAKQRAHIAKLQRRLAKCGAFEALEAGLPKGPEQHWSVTCYAPGEYAAWASVPIDGNPKTFDAGGPTPSAAVAACLAKVKEAGR